MDINNGYVPHEKQRPFHQSKAKFRAIITGVGFGKSAAGANELLKIALQHPNSTHLILAPTSKIMRFATLEEFFKFCPREIIAEHLKSHSTIFLKNGARIIYLTADNERHIDRLRGMEIGSFWADEARLFPSYLWDVLLTRLRDKHGPLIGIVTTTSKGFNWLYYYFVKKKHPLTKVDLKSPEDFEWFGGSTLDNPFTPQEYKDTLLDQLSGKFARQEIYGEFVGFEGQVYDNFKHDIHILHKLPEGIVFKEFIGCQDWGFTNPAASLLIGIDNDDRVYVLAENYKTKQKILQLSDWWKNKLDGRNNFVNVYCDPSEPLFISEFQNAEIQSVKANNEVSPGINFVYSLFEVKEDGKPRLYILESCTNLIDELNYYRYADKKEDKGSKEEPLKVNDHACDALRYGLYSHLGSRGSYVVLDGDGGMF